jgi:serine-type D-Ala-D-Ala carboxypeptidase (penicillin-binding protein 5/6)
VTKAAPRPAELRGATGWRANRTRPAGPLPRRGRPRGHAARALPALLVLLAAVLGAVPPAPPAAAGPTVARPAELTGPPPGPVAMPAVRARSFLLADAVTGQVLLARDAARARPMASTTKVMTALLVLERLRQQRVVTISTAPGRLGVNASLQLRSGEHLTVRQLLLGLMLESANDAAVALAEAVDSSEAAFVRRMNRRAAALGLTATHYASAHGLDRPGHRTSARDLARLWTVAMRRADFRALVATERATIPGPRPLRRFSNRNELLFSYRWTEGGKTGFTNLARRCLVASASRGGRRLLAVALGSPNAFTDLRALFEYGFTALVRARLARAGQVVRAPAGGWQVTADVDVLVRRDLLGRVALRVAPAAPGQGGAPAAWVVAGTSVIAPVAVRPADGAASPETLRPGPVPAGAGSPRIDPFLAPRAA